MNGMTARNEESDESNTPAPLVVVGGIKESHERALRAAGFTTVADLADATHEELAAVETIDAAQATRIGTVARQLDPDSAGSNYYVRALTRSEAGR